MPPLPSFSILVALSMLVNSAYSALTIASKAGALGEGAVARQYGSSRVCTVTASSLRGDAP
jgi:hypothetical protein